MPSHRVILLHTASRRISPVKAAANKGHTHNSGMRMMRFRPDRPGIRTLI